MSTYLLISSGDGPGECQLAVGHVLTRMDQEAETAGIDFSATEGPGRDGPASAWVSLSGDGAMDLARRWIGTIKWICRSPLRPQHKRQNWFVGIYHLTPPTEPTSLDPGDVTFSTLRAGGPGGQHQNTTDSAVRAVHRPTGLTVVARSERSQHRNKAEAIVRLQALLTLSDQSSTAKARRAENLLHHSLERGNPIRTFKGERFIEVR